jgi:predicted nucleic acid-binding protein
MRIVVDASVAIKWFVPEVQSEFAIKLLSGKYQLHAPELLLPEFGNIIWKKYRSGQITSDEANEIMDGYKTVPVQYHPHGFLIKSAFEGAIITGATVYDWTYLILADWLECSFITADQRFCRAVQENPKASCVIWIEEL